MNTYNYVKKNHIQLSQDDIIKNFDDKQLVIKSQLALVLNIAKSFHNTSGIPLEDLFSVGLIGLTKAYDGYSSNNNAKATFTTYASLAIRNEIITFVKTNPIKNIISIPATYDSNKKTVQHHKVYPNSTFDEDYLKLMEPESHPEYNWAYETFKKKLIKLVERKFKEEEQIIFLNYAGINRKKLSFKEVANLINKSAETARQKYKRIIERIQQDKEFITLYKHFKDYNDE